jgi:sterol desaturase/sphingolipid hydroxylase (fatty acid hydroxylase superfamily)
MDSHSDNTALWQQLLQARYAWPMLLLAAFWCWETWRPFFGFHGRVRHAARNLMLAAGNTAVLALVFGGATVAVAAWTADRGLGLLQRLQKPGFLEMPGFSAIIFVLALVLLDGWMYLWHRANHRIPFLWRFHRMHHSDQQMDVTTAVRFHLGEVALGHVLRLGLIPLLGLSIWHLVIYDLLVNAATTFHHADISLGRADRYLRWLVVTPNMHKVHHSCWRAETDSNYSTVLALWDHLARSYRMRQDVRELRFGVDELDEPRWQTLWGMLRTPLASRPKPSWRSAVAKPSPVQPPAGQPGRRPDRQDTCAASRS